MNNGILPISSLVPNQRAPKKLDTTGPILLITPPSIFLLDERVFMSLGILKVAAVLEKAGFPVEFLDLSGVENFVDVAGIHIKQSLAKFVAITATTPQLPAAVKIAERIRSLRPDVRIIIGGPHVTLVHSAVKLEKKACRIGRAHHALENLETLFDVLVSGDGEASIFEALDDDAPKLIDADIPKGGLFMSNADYEATPYPARHLVDVASYKYTIEGHKATSLIAQLGCPFMCGFSLTGDTLISTSHGFERLENLVEGEGELERCIHGGAVRVHKIRDEIATRDGWSFNVEVIDEGTRPVFEVQTENGLKVRSTEEHPFLTACNDQFVWKKTADLKIGDWLVIKNPHRKWPTEYVKLSHPNLPSIPPGGFKLKDNHTVPAHLTPNLSWLIGFIAGDGCIPMDGRPSIRVCVTPDVQEKLVRIVHELFNVELVINKSSVTDKMHHGWIHSRLVYLFFTETLGVKPGNKLHIPQVILNSPQDVLESFLRGLFDADGYDTGHGEYLTTASWDLARETANAILMLGDIPNIKRIDNNGSSHFRVSSRRYDIIPTRRAVYKSAKSGKWYWRTFRQPKNVGLRRETLQISGLSHPFNIDGFHYVRVKSITAGLSERVYDLRVPGSHSFLADGIISHNCGGRNSKMLRQIRTRSTTSIVQEVEHLHKTYGFTAFMFYDDEMNVNKNMVELMNAIADLQSKLGVEFRLRGFVKSELFTEAQAQAMYRAGFRWVLCGFEAANPRILENINKKATLEDNTRVIEVADKFGLKTKALMSVGHPGESEQSIMDVRDWLIKMHPDDFDCTTITTYPGTPYYDEALPHPTMKDVWTYTCKNGDRLHSYDVDYCQVADYYKGDPSGGYHSYVFTDTLSGDQIVKFRDQVENEVRAKLNIPFNPGAPGIRFEHSMGQGQLPRNILRMTEDRSH